MNIPQEILDWSEAWAPLIPLVVAALVKPKGRWTKPVIIFLVLAFVLNLISNVIWKRYHLGLENWMRDHLSFLYDKVSTDPMEEIFSNQILYNLHSILRCLFFMWFFHYMGKVFRIMNWVFIPAFVLVITTVFIFYKDIRDLSSLLLATDAALLLIYCLIYYFIILKDDQGPVKREPHFWVVIGLSIYVVINFPIFLFYTIVSREAEKFAIDIWDLHNITYIIFCLFIAKAFYAANKY